MAVPFCHTLGPSGSPVASEHARGYTGATYDDLEDLLDDGF